MTESFFSELLCRRKSLSFVCFSTASIAVFYGNVCPAGAPSNGQGNQQQEMRGAVERQVGTTKLNFLLPNAQEAQTDALFLLQLPRLQMEADSSRGCGSAQEERFYSGITFSNPSSATMTSNSLLRGITDSSQTARLMKLIFQR